MSDIAIHIESLSKQYRLGTVGTGTLHDDLNRWWHRIRGKEDPYLKIGETNDRAHRGSSEYVWALRDINLEVKQGEVLGIIGKNGAGKSTLLKILSKVTGPTTGRIMAKGRIASLLEVGTGFHPELTGRENIYLNGAILGMTKAEVSRKLDEIVDFAGVERYLDTPVKRYSSGMKVRLGFAVAAFLEEEILIVDEVLAVGDAEFQKKAIGKMQEVSSGGGRTVLFVSHNMAAVENLCPKCILLENGAISLIDKTPVVIQEYLNLQTELMQENIEKRQDRLGGKIFRFLDIEFLSNELDKVTATLKTGDDTLIKIACKSESQLHEDGFIISIGFFTRHRNLLFACRSDSTGDRINISKGTQELFCSIPKLPLKPGDYLISLIAYYKGEVIDWVKEAKLISVVAGDYYGSGKLPAENQGGVCIDYSWSAAAENKKSQKNILL